MDARPRHFSKGQENSFGAHRLENIRRHVQRVATRRGIVHRRRRGYRKCDNLFSGRRRWRFRIVGLSSDSETRRDVEHLKSYKRAFFAQLLADMHTESKREQKKKRDLSLTFSYQTCRSCNSSITSIMHYVVPGTNGMVPWYRSGTVPSDVRKCPFLFKP